MDKTVMLIEDDEEVIALIVILLEELGCNVVLANPSNYLSVIKKQQPDVIILDYWVYDTLGSVICLQLKSSNETAIIPVILTSAVNNIAEIGKECMADDVLAKPFDIDVMQGMVNKWIEGDYATAR